MSMPLENRILMVYICKHCHEDMKTWGSFWAGSTKRFSVRVYIPTYYTDLPHVCKR